MYQTVTSFVLKPYFYHPRRSVRTSASVGADVCVGRCGHLRRSVRMSASVDTDICVGRCGHLRRSMRMSASVGANNKNGCIKAAWVYKKVQLRQLHPLVIPVGFKPTTFRTFSRPSLSALKIKRCSRLLRLRLRGYGRMPYPPNIKMCNLERLHPW